MAVRGCALTSKPAGGRIAEVKRGLDGSERRFDCELVDATRARVVVLYRFERDGEAIDSYGVFWKRRPYDCYYALPAAGGPPVFVRFDVIRGLEFALEGEAPEVRYTDLLLDLWVDADGARWEDEDEVERALAHGALTPEDAARIERARRLLDRRHRRVALEVRALLAALGRPGR